MRKKNIIAVVALLMIVVVGELVSLVVRSTSSSLQDRSDAWTELRCVDHGRQWVASDKTQTPNGSCH